MPQLVNRKDATRKRHYRMRRKLSGTSQNPRLSVYRSGKHIYAQIIDDLASETITSASSVESDFKKSFTSGGNIKAASEVGATIARRALEKGVQRVVFDRGGNLYHGRVSALADAAREAGLKF